MQSNPKKAFLGIPQLSLRAILIGMLGSVLITASSMYVALRMSALPWPTVFVAVLSMALLKILRNTNLNEINIAQTGMEAGAMVAGGIAFTIPGLWISGIYQPYDAQAQTLAEWFLPKFWPVLLIAAAGMTIGSLLCWLLRPRFIEQDKLPYPIGVAAAETIQSGDEGGKYARILFATLGLTAVFTALRDQIARFPQAISGRLFSVPIALNLSPMAIGIGYIIGVQYTAYWFAGALFSTFILQHLGLVWNVFADADAVAAFNLTAAIGLMVGSGAGILLSFLYGLFQKKEPASQTDPATANGETAKRQGKLRLSLIALLAVGLSFVLSVLAGISPLASVLLMIGVLVATGMAATITGQAGINPMEIFGIIILLAVRLFVTVDPTAAFLITAVVAVACGYTGDLFNDYKAGYMLRTHPAAQLVSQLFGGLIGIIVASLAVFAMIYQFGGVGADTGLSAAQAHSVSAMVTGIGDPFVFLIAAIFGCLLYLKKVPAMIIGIGMLLPFGLSAAILLGGLIRLGRDALKKTKDKESKAGNVIAAGLLGGEGITGVAIAIFSMFTGR